MHFWLAIRNHEGFFYFVSRCLLGHENIHDPYIISRKKLGRKFLVGSELEISPTISRPRLVDKPRPRVQDSEENQHFWVSLDAVCEKSSRF